MNLTASARVASAMRLMLTMLVRLYQLVLRPILGPNCRFVPSCSDYALDALARHGVVRGLGLTGARILRCNPWHPGGHDPVPCATCCAPTPLPPHPDRDRPAR